MLFRHNHLIPVLVYTIRLLQAICCTTYGIRSTGTDNTNQPFNITLAEFSANPTENENITLILQPGNHALFNNFSLSNIIGVSIYPYTNHLTSISCTFSLHLTFENIEHLYIQNIQIKNCSIKVVNLQKIVFCNMTFDSLRHVGIKTALILINVTAEINNCSFSHNQVGTFQKKIKSKFTTIFYFKVKNITGNVYVGGAILSSHSNVKINQSLFVNNMAEIGGDLFIEEHSNVSILNSVFIGPPSKSDADSTVSYFGGAIFSDESNVTMKECQLSYKDAIEGGAILTSLSTFTIIRSKFWFNFALDFGGALFTYHSLVKIHDSDFQHNIAASGGGALSTHNGKILLEFSSFINNTAYSHAGAVDFYDDTSTIRTCLFMYNNAHLFGGTILQFLSTTTMDGNGPTEQSRNDNETTTLTNILDHCINTFNTSNNITLQLRSCEGIIFAFNTAPTGATIYTIKSTLTSHSPVVFYKNMANQYSFAYFLDSDVSFGSTMIAQNLGSFFAFNCNVFFHSTTIFLNGTTLHNATLKVKEGGAITAAYSRLTFHGITIFQYNQAIIGGAIVASQSEVHVRGAILVINNEATKSGGGMYLSQSELYSEAMSTILISRNSAGDKGGGIHAISSSIKCIVTGSKYTDVNETVIEKYTGAVLIMIENSATQGGALYMQANSKLTLLKDYVFELPKSQNTMSFVRNTADYGGAVYVDDESNSDACASNPFDASALKAECFLQVVATHTSLTLNTTLSLHNVEFDNNYAKSSGSTLFGGLLDRCIASPFNEVERTIDLTSNSFLVYDEHGLQYLMDITTGITTHSISSNPVQICLCTDDNNHICNRIMQTHVFVKKGYPFNISLTAVDQIYRPVYAIIQGHLQSTESLITEGQAKKVTSNCNNLQFKATSSLNSEVLTLYAADGPCKDSKLSSLQVHITFLPCTCPVGFRKSQNHRICECLCDPYIQPYVECILEMESFQRTVNAWISHINYTDPPGYLVHVYCPFDYCLPPNISAPVNLNKENGADAQCALNRRGLLCGTCIPGLSLSLGSSRCLGCPKFWPALFLSITILALLSGVALVVLCLLLNMTVAVGTLNGLLFYANIVAANRAVLLPYPQPRFVTVFIAWLNLELGIDVCYIDGMDIYAKTWLQLAFPIYIIFLVILLIIISNYSSKFSKLIGKKNPITTLATLILLSYGKLMHVVLLAQPFSFATLSYPDGTSKLVWLPDGTVDYATGKHIALLIVAFLILVACLAYSLLLLCWQLILYCPNRRILRFARNPKLYLFMEAYHVPYVPRHRYWTGLLLIARAVLYLIAAANVSGNPHVQLTAITFVLSFIIFLKMLTGSKIFKKWFIDAIDSFFYFNTLLFAFFTSYNLNTGRNQDTIAYTSVTLSFLVVLLIIFYHVYTFTTLLSRMRNNVSVKNIIKRFKVKSEEEIRSPPSCVNNDDRFDGILDIIDSPISDNAQHDSCSIPQEPTSSVVELP